MAQYNSPRGSMASIETLKTDSHMTQDGGLIVIGETVAILHREIQGSKV